MGPKVTALSFLLLTLFVNSHQSSYSAQSTECPANFNGSIAGEACSREYSICINGVRQDATCIDGQVFHDTSCVPKDESPECEVNHDEVDTEEEELPTDFDCGSKSDGAYSLGCENSFVKCVAGYAYHMYCPVDLFYNANYDECLESCDKKPEVVEGEEELEVASTAAPQISENEEENGEANDEPVTEEGEETTTEQPEFECAGLEDGIYADGCLPFFFTCSNGFAFKKFCPEGTVFNPSQKACDYDCVAAEATTTTVVPEFTTTEGETETTTTPESTTTRREEPITVEITTTPQAVVSSTTQSTTTLIVDTTIATTPQIPVQVCREGEVTTFGTCSSRFDRCQNNTVKSKQCPVNTLFEAPLAMCVYDLPQCQPVTVPVGNGYPSTYNQDFFPQPDIVVSPFDDNVRLRPRFDRRREPHRQDNYIVDNPFFVPSHRPHHRPHHKRNHERRERHHYGPRIDSPFSTHHRGRAFFQDSFKDFRSVRMDKLQYGEARKVTGDKRFIVNDGFNGPKAKFMVTDVQQVFPMRHTNRRLGPRANPDAYEDGSGFEPKDLFGATRRKRSTYYGAQQTGFAQPSNQISGRQAQVNKDCQTYTGPTFLTFGDCFDQFIYCSGTGTNRMAACPIGESFDKTLRACSETCGTSSPIVTVTESTTSTGTQTESDDSVTTAPPQPSTSTTSAPIGDRCSQVSLGLFAAFGCSQKYIQCSNGAAIVRECPAALYFNEASAGCDFRDQVPECQTQDSTSTSAPIVTLPAADPSSTQEYTTAAYDNQPTTYSPAVLPYNPIASDDACAGLADGSHGQGCSSSFIVCSAGRLVKSINCALGEGFDPSVQFCRSFNLIPAQACDATETTTDAGLAQPLPYATLEDVLTTTVEPDTTVVANDEVVVETTTPSASDATDDDEELSAEEKNCTVGSRVPIGFCVKTFLECTATGYVEKVCRVGKQFDTSANKCVARLDCGRDAIRQAVEDVISATSTTVSPKKIDGRCAHVDGEAVFSLGSCSSNYVRCSYGSAKLEHCSDDNVFSNARLVCVSRDAVSECIAQNQPVKSFFNNHQQDAFCDGKADGLYGNKKDCSAVLQCFGGELFEHPACPSNLAFNELSGKCDYPQKVSGCENHSLDVGECAEHGAFVADVQSCSTFYRCVWGRKVTQKCPSGTVFNPALSVCDWPTSVPSCAGPAADSNGDSASTTTSSSGSSSSSTSAPYGDNYGY